MGHDRPEIRATDTNVDNVANTLPSVALPRAAPHAAGKVGHLVEDGMHLWNNVLAIDNDRSPSLGTECHMKHCAVFGNVDLFASEHGVDPLTQPRLICELHE